jgi:Kae1-associated kinase Bud32
MWFEECVLHIGAEATVSAGTWLGRRAVLKKREPRAYRHPDLDRRLTRQRMNVEARVLSRLQKSGFAAPSLLDLDVEEGWMLLSRIDGRPLFEALRDDSAGLVEVKEFGGLIRRLHESGVSHGDLTTHNVMIDERGAMSLIDFGLSRIAPEIEHLGLDLQVLNECLTASHHRHQGAVDAMLDGYCSADSGTEPSTAEVIERFDVIRSRVRYHS